MVFVIAVAAIMFPILIGLGLGNLIARFDRVVEETKEEIDNKDKGYNPALTMGYKIKTTEETEAQTKEARKLAAKKAASTPRGANMRIGRLGQSTLKSAWEGVDEDPLTAVKIAEFHGWDGLKTGAVAVTAGGPVAAPTGGQVAAGKIQLVAGKDYEVIEITDDMPGSEKRKARIANAKAKSAAYKAAKAAGVPATAAVPQPSAAPIAAAAVPQVAPPTNIEPPQLVEITDDMSPDEKRKARIANSKAKSAYNKALKAAGIDPRSVKEGQAVQVETPAAAPAPAPQAAPAPAPAQVDSASAAAGIPKPELIEITDDMPPEEKRAARISNSKATSAYKKALKAAGIDPKTVKI